MVKQKKDKEVKFKLIQIRVSEAEWTALEEMAIEQSEPGNRVYVSTLVKRLIDKHLLKGKLK